MGRYAKPAATKAASLMQVPPSGPGNRCEPALSFQFRMWSNASIAASRPPWMERRSGSSVSHTSAAPRTIGMARFYFHATDGRELVRDAQGHEIARPDELLSRAQLVARRVMATRRSHPHWRAWTVVVMDERGSMMLAEPFPPRLLSKR